MHKLNIQTTQNVGISYPTASLVERIYAFLIDQTIILLYAILIIYSLTTIEGASHYDLKNVVYFLIIPVFLFYRLAFEYLNNGQTPGKKIMKLRVINADGSRPSWMPFFTRWLIGLLELILLTGSPALIAIAVTNKNQRLGDIAADTTVIKEQPLVLKKHLIDKDFGDDYTIKYPMAEDLSEQQANIINSVLQNQNNFLRNKQIISLSAQLKAFLNIKNYEQENDREFIAQVLSDYSYLKLQNEKTTVVNDIDSSISQLLQ